MLDFHIVFRFDFEDVDAGGDEVPAILRETHAIQDVYRHVRESYASCCFIVPKSENGVLAVFAILARGDQVALAVEIKTANGRGVPEEEPFLFVGFGVHRDHGSTG